MARPIPATFGEKYQRVQKAVAADPKYAPAWYYIGNVLSNKMTMDKDGNKPIAPPGNCSPCQP